MTRALGRAAAGALVRLLVVLALVGLAGTVAAQESPTPAPAAEAAEAAAQVEGSKAAEPQADWLKDHDLDAWLALAERAESVLETGQPSDAALYDLRAQIDRWRAIFAEAQNTNQARIKTIKEQIAALGPPPENGTEAPEVASRRAELEAELQRVSAPALEAELQRKRAEALIAEIDRIIRQRRAEALVRLDPSPLDPANWPAALSAARGVIDGVRREVDTAFASEGVRATLRDNGPLILGHVLAALLLLLRGRRWIATAEAYLIHRRPKGAGRDLWGELLSLGAILLPLAGLALLSRAILLTGISGIRVTVLVDGLPVWGAIFLFAYWLADRLTARHGSAGGLPLAEGDAPRAWRHALALGVLYVSNEIIDAIGAVERFPVEVMSVLKAPVLVLAGLSLFRLGQILARAAQSAAGGAENEIRARVMGLVGRVSQAIAVSAALLALVGYRIAAEWLAMPWLATLAVFGALERLMLIVRLAYRRALGVAEGEEGLLPILLDVLLVLGALPVLALIWGAQPTELAEFWRMIVEGISVGPVRISPVEFFTFVLVFVVGYTITRLVQASLRQSVLPRTRLDPGARTAIVSGVGYLGIFLSAFIAITTAGIDLSSLALVAGALSVGIGFGLQNIVSNFVSGVILLIERPIAEGDWVEVGGKQGYVRDISVRSTVIETFDRTEVIVPNSEFISGVVTNFTRNSPIGRVIVPVGVAYGTDTRKVEEILHDIAQKHPMVLLEPRPNVLFRGFGASSLDFEIRAIIRDINYIYVVMSDINHEIARRFAEEGIEIPFPQRDLWFRNPEALRGAAPGGGTEGSQEKGEA